MPVFFTETKKAVEQSFFWQWVWKYFGRFSQVTTGWGLFLATSWAYDNVLYLVVLNWLGFFWGGVTMTVLSFFITLLLLLYYERMKVNWLGMDTLEEIRQGGFLWMRKAENHYYERRWMRVFIWMALFIPKIIGRFVVWFLNKGNVFAFVTLSLWMDPFITTAYFRRGRFDGLKRRDWEVFVGSCLLSNIAWVLWSWGVLSTIKRVWLALG